MEYCTACGLALTGTRFCTGCGQASAAGEDWRTGTAERPAVASPPEAEPEPDPMLVPRSALPPPVVSAPPAARYPLFADEARTPAAPPDQSSPTAAVPSAPAASPASPARTSFQRAPVALGQPPTPSPDHRDRSRGPWVVGLVALVLMAVVGGVLLLTGRDDPEGQRAEDRAGGAVGADGADGAGNPTEPSTPRRSTSGESTSPQPDRSPTKTPTRKRPAQITRSLDVAVPATAPPNQDVAGNLVRYEATNMIDGVPTTCWRMPGSGAGEEVVLSLARPTKVAQVGIVNGYAKTSGDLDWYRGNRRVLAVEWVFDDGTTVAQSLEETRAVQTIAIEKPVKTSTIRLRLVDVSAPGRGRSARNYTAISDVSVTGSPA